MRMAISPRLAISTLPCTRNLLLRTYSPVDYGLLHRMYGRLMKEYKKGGPMARPCLSFQKMYFPFYFLKTNFLFYPKHAVLERWKMKNYVCGCFLSDTTSFLGVGVGRGFLEPAGFSSAWFVVPFLSGDGNFIVPPDNSEYIIVCSGHYGPKEKLPK